MAILTEHEAKNAPYAERKGHHAPGRVSASGHRSASDKARMSHRERLAEHVPQSVHIRFAQARRSIEALIVRLLAAFRSFLLRGRFSSLTRRIVVFNVVGLCVL